MLRKSTLIGFCGYLCAVLGYIGCIGVSGHCSAEVQSIQELLTTTQPGPHAIPIKVWSEKKRRDSFREGERIVIAFQAAQPAYVMILACSSSGDVAVLFPNKDRSDNFVGQEKIYTLFGDDSTLRLSVGGEYEHGGLVLCASAKPFTLNALKGLEHQQRVTIPANALEQMETLRSTIQAMAKEAGFNRVFVPVSGDKKENHEVVVSLSPDQAKPVRPKGLPASVESSEPEVITGSAGFKPVKQGSDR